MQAFIVHVDVMASHSCQTMFTARHTWANIICRLVLLLALQAIFTLWGRSPSEARKAKHLLALGLASLPT